MSHTWVMFIDFSSAMKASLVGAKTVPLKLGSFRGPAWAHELSERPEGTRAQLSSPVGVESALGSCIGPAACSPLGGGAARRCKT